MCKRGVMIRCLGDWDDCVGTSDRATIRLFVVVAFLGIFFMMIYNYIYIDMIMLWL